MKKQVTWIWTMLCILLLAACEKPVLENYDGVKPTGKSKSKSTRIVRTDPANWLSKQWKRRWMPRGNL